MKSLRFFCRHWYTVGLAVALLALLALILHWGELSVLLRLNTVSFIAMLVHQFEEYGFPGGEPMIMNRVLQGSDAPDRYPLNQFSAMLTNVLFAYGIYLLPILFPQVIWLGIAPMLMGMMQFVVHGILTNRKMKSLYNPGLGAVVCLHIPVGIWYIAYITRNHLATAGTWALGILYTILATALILGYLTYVALPDRNTPWVFAAEELRRFQVEEKLRQKHIAVDTSAVPAPLRMIEKLKEGRKRP